MFDRLLASTFGVHAIDLLAKGQSEKLIVWRGGNVTDIPIPIPIPISLADAAQGPRFVPINGEIVRTTCGLGIYLWNATG